MSQEDSACQTAQGNYIAQAHGKGAQAKVELIQQAPLSPTPAIAPPPPSHFTGRRAHLDALKVTLRTSQTTQRIALQGMAGIGKTATALKLAAELAPDFPGGVFWGSLADHDGNPRSILRAWGRACAQDLAAEPNPNVLASLVRGLLAARLAKQGRLLVIVDDLRDEWLEAAQLLAQATPAEVPCLLTTRDETLATALDATLYRLDTLLPDEALALLKAHVGDEVVATDLEAAEVLLETVSHLPLAIELAGKRLAILAHKPGYRLSAFGEAVAQRAAEVLTLRGQSGLVATFAITYDALPVELRRTFRWLGIFAAGPFHVVSVAGVLGLDEAEAEEALDTLVSRALLAWGEAERMYTVHPLLRQYAQALLHEAGEAEEAARGHLDYYLAFARSNAPTDPAAHYQIDPAAHARLEAALPNLLAAIDVATQVGDHRAIIEFGYALHVDSRFLEMRGYADEAVDLLTRSAAACREIGDRRGEAKALGNLGLAYHGLGQVERAIEYHQQDLAITRELRAASTKGSSEWTAARRDECYSLSDLGIAYRALGQVERAIEYHEQSLDIAREIRAASRKGSTTWKDARLAEGDRLGCLGSSYYLLGQMKQAIDLYQQSLAIASEIRAESTKGSPEWTAARRDEGIALGNLGKVCSALDQVEQAIEYHEQSLAIAREVGDRRYEGAHLGNLGSAYRDSGQVERAIECHKQTLVIAHEIGARGTEGGAMRELGLDYSALGQVEQAIDYYQQALAIFEEIKSPSAERIRVWLAELAGSLEPNTTHQVPSPDHPASLVGPGAK